MCVDGPLNARVLCENVLIWCESGRVSGLLARHRGRWPRWVPRSTPKRACDLEGRHPTRVLWIVGSTDQHLLVSALTPLARRAGSGCYRRGSPIAFPACQHGPHNAGHLVGQSHRRDLARLAIQQFKQPCRGALALWLGEANDRHRAQHQQLSQALIPGPADPAEPLLAAGGFSRGTRPSQAAKCRPDLNCVASTRKPKLSAPIGPIPGTSDNRRQSALALHCPINFASVSASRASIRSISRPSRPNASAAGAGNVASPAISARNVSSPLPAFGATSPSSAA
jgi:hypothetical protein